MTLIKTKPFLFTLGVALIVLGMLFAVQQVRAADPSVEILYPNGGEVLLGGNRAPIVWTADYPLGATVSLYYRTTSSAAWKMIVRDIDPDEESITWHAPNVDGSSARIRAVLEYDGGSVEDQSDTSFTLKRTEQISQGGNIRDKVIVTYPHTVTLEVGDVIDVTWDYSGDDATEAEIYYSVDNGDTFQLIADGLDPELEVVAWTVPSIPTEEGRIQAIIKDVHGERLAIDWNHGFFTILGVASSTQIAGEEVTLDVTIDTDDVLIKTPCPADSTFRHPCRTVYYLGNDGNRHAFPNEKVYFSWYDNYDAVQIITEEDMQRIPLGRNVRYQAGVHLVKFQTFSTVFAVERGGVLRAIQGEDVARDLYGLEWNKNVHDISDVFFNNYTYGDDIVHASQYDLIGQRAATRSINENLE